MPTGRCDIMWNLLFCYYYIDIIMAWQVLCVPLLTDITRLPSCWCQPWSSSGHLIRRLALSSSCTVNVLLQLSSLLSSLSSDTVCGYYNGFENHSNIRVTEEPHIVNDFCHHKVVAYLHYNGDLSGKPMVSKRSWWSTL